MMDSVHLIPERDRVIFQRHGGWDTATTLNVNFIIDPLPFAISGVLPWYFNLVKPTHKNKVAEFRNVYINVCPYSYLISVVL